MQIIIEGYQYPAGSVNKVLWEGAFQTVDGKVSIGYVGYYWNDRLKDSVFVLPKGHRRGWPQWWSKSGGVARQT